MSKIKIKPRSILCIVLKENKSVTWQNVSVKKDSFKVGEHRYFTTGNGAYLGENRTLISTYLEGIPLPMHHGLIKTTVVKKKIFNDITGKEETHSIKEIEGFKQNSEAVNMILNQKLAEMFTKIPLDMPNFLLALLLIGTVILGVINILMWFI